MSYRGNVPVPEVLYRRRRCGHRSLINNGIRMEAIHNISEEEMPADYLTEWGIITKSLKIAGGTTTRVETQTLNLMFIGLFSIVIVEEWKTNLVSLAILFHFLGAQHVSDINISIIRSLRLCCWITTSVVLFSVRCVLEIWCGWFWVVLVLQVVPQPATRTPPKTSYTKSPTRNELRTRRPMW